MKVKLQNVRLAFPALFEPKTVGDKGEPRFSAAFPIDPKSENAKLLSEAVRAVAVEKWAKKADDILGELRKKGRVAYREEALSKDGEVYDGFEGMHTLNASNKARPLVLDRDKSPLVATDGKPYAGCYVNVMVDIWAQDNSFGKRINGTLSGIQFYRDGDAFGGAAPARTDDFDDLGEGADSDDLA